MPKAQPIEAKDLALIPFFILALAPFLFNGYYYDDGTHHSYIPEVLQTQGLTYWEYLTQNIRHWLENGRIHPLRWLISTLPMYLIDDQKTFRFLHVLSVALNIVLVMAIVREITGSRSLGAFLAAFIFLFFQHRTYHDPIASYGFLMQCSLFFRLGSQYLFWVYLRGGSKRVLYASLALYTMGILDYEPALGTFPVIVGLIYLERRKGNPAKWNAMIPFAAVTAVYLIALVWLKATAERHYAGTDIGDWRLFAQTYFIQFAGAWPLTGAKQNLPGFWQTLPNQFSNLWTIAQVLALTGLSSVILYRNIDRHVREPAVNNLDILFFLAVTRFSISPAFVAISARYQKELRFGWAYLPVYTAYFGAAIFSATLLLWAFKRLHQTNPESSRFGAQAAAASGVLSLLIAFTFLGNKHVSNTMDSYWTTPRTMLSRAIERGLLEGVDSEATIVMAAAPIWMTPEFFSKALPSAPKKLILANQLPASELRELALKDLQSRNLYYLSFSSETSEVRWAALGKLSYVLPPAPTRPEYEFLTEDTRLYARVPPGESLEPAQVEGVVYNETPKKGVTAYLLRNPVSELEPLKSGGNWQVFKLPVKVANLSRLGITLVE